MRAGFVSSNCLAGVALLVAALAVGTSGRAATSGPIHIEAVSVTVRPLSPGVVASEVTIATSAAPRFSARLADNATRLLIDISDADVARSVSSTTDPVGLVAGVLTQGFRDSSGLTARVAITLSHAAAYRIRPTSTGLVVSLTAVEAAGSEPTDAPRTAGESPRIRDVHFVAGKGRDTVTIELSSLAAYSATNGAAGKSRLELTGAALPKELERILDVSSASTRVRAVSATRSGANVVLEAERGADVSAQVKAEGTTLVWTFTRPGDAVATETGVAPDGGAARKTRTLAREARLTDLPAVERGVGAVLRSGELVESATAAAEAAAFLPTATGQPAGHYTGRRIDLDLKDADIHNVLRLLADVGRVNVVTADNVTGTITIRMRNVPWDQALDVVLQAKGLGMQRQGNLLRIAPLAELEKEREMAIARRKQELELAPVETRLVPVSYAGANEIQPRARELLSSRGSIAVDERTNVLIVRDVAATLNQIEELVRALDTQTPQVLVEARIVEATSRYLRDVGIQWGGDATFSPATGNPTGLAFPSAIGIAGGASDGATPTAGLSPFDRTVANPNFAVNLPAAVGTGSGGAIGLTFGSINNTVNLGVRLSAAETSGMLRIISSPRILTMDNRDARISQGTLIPFAQVSAQGVQTTFQEAKLQLLVRPHVTAEGSVAMHVKVNRDEPDFNQTSPRGDPTILKREAETDLLVMDGHTAVIGGIYTRNTGRNLDQVPFFGDIPLLGLMFQRRRASDSRGELVIFLTPRIVNRAEALGR
jgi:type IV pilus assembly protein PilQ